MNRRDFLRTLAISGASGTFTNSFLSRMAYAQTLSSQTPNFVLIRINGAMDCLQGLNPWIGTAPLKTDLHTAYDPMKVGQAGDYQTVLRNVAGSQIHLGPSAQGLAPYVSQMAVINGIWMGPSDLGHPFAVQYASSGRTQEKAPHISAIIANSRQAGNEFFIINGPVEKSDYKLKIMQTVNLSAGLQSPDEETNLAIGAYKNLGGHIANYNALMKSADKIEQFNRALIDLKKTSSTGWNTSSSSGRSPDEDAVVASLASGLSTVAQIDFQESDGGGIDNHFQYDQNHPKGVRARFDRLARFIKNLQEYRLLDKTLVVVITEFSRTSALNSNLGKDHNYSDNSALMIGYGVNGGTVVGSHRLFGAESDREKSELSGDMIDMGTTEQIGSGEVFRSPHHPKDITLSKIPKNIDLIRPANVIATASELVLPGSRPFFGENVAILPKITRLN